jgi:Mor family transcriptional regulator
MNTLLLQAIREIMNDANTTGDEKIELIWQLVGSREVFFSALRKFIRHTDIRTDLQAGMDAKEVAKKYKMTKKQIKNIGNL